MNTATVKKQSPHVSALLLYINYAFQGVATIILAQHMSSLLIQLNTDVAGIAMVMSGLGWGRLATVIPAGWFSDRFGRKASVFVGLLSYVIFFSGILMSTNIWMALIATAFAGSANSFLDTGTYPALAELFPKNFFSATVLLRSFITIGQFILPLVVGFFIANEVWFGYTFLALIVLIIVNGIIISRRNLIVPKGVQKEVEVGQTVESEVVVFNESPNFWIEGIGLITLGFTAVATFSLVVTWLPFYAQEVIGMVEIEALRLVSFYSIAAFVGIFMTAIIVQKMAKPVTVLLTWTSISLLSLVGLHLFPTATMAMFTAVIIGLFAAGGLFQLALAILLELFPGKKGRKTAMMSFAAAIQAIVVPMVTSRLVVIDPALIIIFAIAVTTISVMISIVVRIRYVKLTEEPIKETCLQKA